MVLRGNVEPNARFTREHCLDRVYVGMREHSHRVAVRIFSLKFERFHTDQY